MDTIPPIEQSVTAPAKRMCAYIAETDYVRGQGYRVSFVTENEAGYTPTGTWPYHGRKGETMPWFWGDDLATAKRHAADYNREKFGLTPDDVHEIVTSSMRAAFAR